MIKYCPSSKTMRGACSVASEDESDVLIVSLLGTIHDWILDSESCIHIYSVRDMFDEGSLHPAERTAHLADCKEYGVCYILGLKKHLISVRS
jgi:hypothetical protein